MYRDLPSMRDLESFCQEIEAHKNEYPRSLYFHTQMLHRKLSDAFEKYKDFETWSDEDSKYIEIHFNYDIKLIKQMYQALHDEKLQSQFVKKVWDMFIVNEEDFYKNEIHVSFLKGMKNLGKLINLDFNISDYLPIEVTNPSHFNKLQANWKGTKSQLAFLLEKLKDNNFLDYSDKWAESVFLANGKPYRDNRSHKNSYQSNPSQKPKNAAIIEQIIDEIK